MKTIILVSLLCLCLLATAINADKSHKHQGKLLKSGHEEHKKHSDLQTSADKDEAELKTHNPTNEKTETKPAPNERKHRNNHHHGKNKKGGSNTEANNGRSRKLQTKPNKHSGQRSHNNNKHHGRKHGRGKQSSQ